MLNNDTLELYYADILMLVDHKNSEISKKIFGKYNIDVDERISELERRFGDFDQLIRDNLDSAKQEYEKYKEDVRKMIKFSERRIKEQYDEYLVQWHMSFDTTLEPNRKQHQRDLRYKLINIAKKYNKSTYNKSTISKNVIWEEVLLVIQEMQFVNNPIKPKTLKEFKPPIPVKEVRMLSFDDWNGVYNRKIKRVEIVLEVFHDLPLARS